MPDADLLTTAQVCRILGMTPRQVHRLTVDGYLEVQEVARNKHGEVKLFSEEQVEAVRQKLPRILKKWENEDGARYGVAAAWRRLANWRTFQLTRSRKERFLNSLSDLPEKSASLLRAAYYLYHLNHYAKAGESYLYELKERVLKAFSAHFTSDDGLQIYFISGPARISLCPACRRRAREDKKSYLEYARLTGGCSNCHKEEDYYSLYEFLIACDVHRFCFHSPFQIASKWLKGREIPEKEGFEREGGYPFGRAITPGEAAAVNLAEVIAELEHFLAEGCQNSCLNDR